MTRLEELRHAMGPARRDWKWDELARIAAEIALEEKRLAQVAADLPPPAAGTTMSADSDVESEREDRDTQPPPPPSLVAAVAKSKKKRR